MKFWAIANKNAEETFYNIETGEEASSLSSQCEIERLDANGDFAWAMNSEVEGWE